jgi:hypothetical protein
MEYGQMGTQQGIKTLINEEALLLAEFLRDELREWIPRICQLLETDFSIDG